MYSLNTKKLAKLIREKRGDRTLREIARQLKGKISLATLSRLEQENLPDLSTFFFICEWLEIDPIDLIKGRDKEINPCEAIYKSLRLDTNLDSGIKYSLITFIQLAYKSKNNAFSE